MGMEYGPDQTFNEFTDCPLCANKHHAKYWEESKEKTLKREERDIEK